MGPKPSARIPRIFQAAPLKQGEIHWLDAGATHHVCVVQRANPGQSLILFNGDGHDYPAELLREGKRYGARVLDQQENERESPLRITLAQCISRGERMDRSIRMAVELGVHAIQPLYSEHSQKPLDAKRSAKKLSHWQDIIHNAAEQSGRSRIATLAAAQRLDAWLEQPRDRTLVLDPLSVVSLGSMPKPAMDQSLTVLVGPESGLTLREIDVARAAGCEAVKLGPRVLRTESAGPAVLAALQALHGDFR